MINILVVDDEPISADGISIYLQEHGEDMWAVRTAYNGLQALEIARQRVDILVSDIMMPGLDGFQVQEKIQEMWPMSRCIFLTSAQQIDYIQRAVRSEYIIDYVLKTESEDKILSAVKKAVTAQENAVHTQDILKKAEQDILKIRPVLQKELMLSLLRGEHISFSMERRLRELEFDFQAEQPVLLLLGQLGDESVTDGASDIQVYVLQNFLEKYLRPAYRFYMLSMSDRRIAVLLQNVNSYVRQDVRHVFSLIEAVQQTFRKAGGAVSFAVDDTYCSWEELSAHYHSLIAVLERNLFMDDVLVLRSTSDELPEHSPTEELHKARILLENGSFEEAASVIQLITMPYTIRGRIDLYRKLLKLLIATIDSREQAEHVYAKLHVPLLQTDESGWKNMQLEFVSIFRRLAGSENTPSKRMEQTVETVCRHVKENLSEDLSLVRLAELTDHSSTYLSRIFKEVKGIGYNDFVVECRMERAAYLLQDSKLKLTDIIEQVGYTSSSYFIRTFRRTFGMTPMEYRNRLKVKKQ